MNKFVVLSLLLSVCISSGFALECFVCNSEFNHECQDMKNTIAVPREACDQQLIGKQQHACIKTITNTQNSLRIVRECVKVGARRDICQEKMSQGASECLLCDTQLCNGSSHLLSNIWSTLLPIAVILTIKKFYF